MRLVCTSDTHGVIDFKKRWQVPGGDVFIHAGDLTMGGTKATIESQLELIAKLDFEHAIVIAGNHDKAFERSKVTIPKGMTYLQDSAVTIDGVKFYGSPWTPEFGVGWAFQLIVPQQADSIFGMIPTDTNVLITHGPPRGILDRVLDGVHVGSAQLQEHIKRLPNLKAHIFGHVHEAAGHFQNYFIPGSPEFYNVCAVTLSYKERTPAFVVVDIK